MKRVKSAAGLLGVMAVAACTVAPPTGPSVMVMPADGKSLAQFQQDDSGCRQYASQQIGYGSPADAANRSAVGSAVVGTAIGAAAGAALGAAAGNPGAGAAIGAGSGLLFGSAVGAGNAQVSAEGLQQRYDMSYMQCMASQGDKVPKIEDTAVAYPPPAPVAYAYPPPYYPYPAYGYGPYPGYYGPPGATFVFGFGGGHYRHYR